MRLQKTAAPDKPFFVYFSPGATHAPHHVWPEWIEKFRGRFDDGWDALREEIHARQLELGVIPPGTILTPRPEQIPSWDEYPDRYKPVARRLMEVYAGFLAHTDAQVGRLLDALEELGQAGTTRWSSTSWATTAPRPRARSHGAWSSPSFQNGEPEDPEWLLAHIDDFGSPRCENHFNVGLGVGARRAVPVDEAGRLALRRHAQRHGGLVAARHRGPRRAADAVPPRHRPRARRSSTPPASRSRPTVNGIEQKPIEGVSMRYSLRRRRRAEPPHDPVLRDPRQPRDLPRRLGRGVLPRPPAVGAVAGRRRSARTSGGSSTTSTTTSARAHDLAAEHPEKLRELQALFDREARTYDVYPLSDQTTLRALPAQPAQPARGQDAVHLLPRPRPHARAGDR